MAGGRETGSGRDGAVDVLVLHDGELEDVLRLLDEMGVACAGGPPVPGSAPAPRLLVATLRHLAAPAPHTAARIAIVDGPSRGLYKPLPGTSCDFVVQRPIHPAALRGLLMHALYDGPEKRRRPRVALGEPVEIRCAGRQAPALLVGLSARGAGLVARDAPAVEDAIEVLLPAALTRGASQVLAARVISLKEAPESDGSWGFSVVFTALSSASQSIVSQIMRARARARTPHPPAGESAPAKPRHPATGRNAARTSVRKPYPKAVLATSEGGATPLLGRDVSMGGMRVAPTHGLTLGDELKLVLYGPPGLAPAVVVAEVARDDGEQGWVLHFRDPGAEGRAALEAVVQALPAVASTTEGGDGLSPVVVSEVIEQRA